jgi:hypothetical protein
LNESYISILNRISDHDCEIAKEALSWLCFSTRPLHLDELAEAVIIREGDTRLDSDCRFNNPAILVEICQGLIHYNQYVVTLAHDSIRSFLLSPAIRASSAAYFALDASKSNSQIVTKCLTYIQMHPFSSGPVSERFQLKNLHAVYPLLRYAVNFWPIHLERFQLQEADEKFILAFFETKGSHASGGSFASWVQLLLDTVNLDTVRDTEPLYYAASYNMTSILKILLKPELGVNLNKCGGRFGSPPLFVALWRGNMEAAKLLLAAGANPDAMDSGSGQTSRMLARWRRMDDVLALMDSNTYSEKFLKMLPGGFYA